MQSSAGKKWNARWSHPIPHTSSYYSKCVLGGILSCGITHTAITPLDVVKCNMQVDPGKYQGLLSGIRTILKEEGYAGLVKGWGPTAVGYSLQGAGKFGFYEIFKDTYSTMVGEENAYTYRGLIFLAGAASAEFLADILLCPWEMTKVRVQTSPNGSFPTAFGPALKEMRANAKETRFPFGSLVPLWGRQIPCKFQEVARNRKHRRVLCRSPPPLLVHSHNTSYLLANATSSQTPWPNSTFLKKSSRHGTRTSLHSPKSPTRKPHNWALHLLRDTWPESFVPL